MEKKSIFNLFGRKGKTEDEPQADVPVDESTLPMTAESLPHTLVSLTPEQEQKYSEQEKQRFQEILMQLPPLRMGEINFVPYEVGMINGGYFVKVFIRHGRDLLEDFTLGPLPLTLVDAVGDKVASGFFNPQKFGTLKFGESRPWTFGWSAEQVVKPDPDFSSFTIRFE